MSEISEAEFDKAVKYTLRVELICGKILLYHVDTENKNYLINKLKENSDGDYDQKEISFLWLETSLNRYVIINANEIVRVIFCFDAIATVGEDLLYYDNFDTLEQTDEMKEKHNKWFNRDSNEHTLPQVIVYCKGSIRDKHYDPNPFTYSSLDEGCLSALEVELEGDMPFRQFINLIDDDGEESFIPLKKIIVMELDANLIFRKGR